MEASSGAAPSLKTKQEIAIGHAYVEQRHGAYESLETRVSPDSIAYGFLSGQSAEAIAQAFPVLTLAQVYGAMPNYLAHWQEVDRYLEGRRHDCAAARQAARDADPMFYQKLVEAKKQTPVTRVESEVS